MTGPAVFERSFRVRSYECDAYGHVNHANYLRYMQEAALDASADVGYGVARYQAMDRLWLVHDTDITYLRPLRYGDVVTVRTWVADFRRVRSQRAYELFLAGSGEPVANATSDWVFLDATTMRPATIPTEIVAAYFDGIAPVAEKPAKFPEAPPPPPGTFTLRHTVEWRDIDQAGHVNNANYLAYIEECNTHVCIAHGWPMERMLAMGMGIVARRYRIEYRLPALMSDELEIATYVSDARRSTAVRHYTIRRAADGELLVRANVLWVWIDLATGRPRRIPPEFRESFQDNMVVVP